MDGQTILAVIVGAALAAFSLVMVGYAFFRGDVPEDEDSVAPAPPGDDSVGLDAIYDSIDTLELDYQLGNVPEEQYRQQLQGYRVQAAMAVRSMLERGEAPPELLLEQEVLAARRNGLDGTPGTSDETDLPDENGPVEEWAACPQCDAPIPPSEAPCPHCGVAIVEAPSPSRGEG